MMVHDFTNIVAWARGPQLVCGTSQRHLHKTLVKAGAASEIVCQKKHDKYTKTKQNIIFPKNWRSKLFDPGQKGPRDSFMELVLF